MKKFFKTNHDEDSYEIRSIKKTLNSLVDEYGLEKVEELMSSIRVWTKLESDQYDTGTLTPDDIKKGIRREYQIKEFYKKMKNGKITTGRRNIVEDRYHRFVGKYEDDDIKGAAIAIYDARMDLSRTSFWRLRKKIEDEYGWDPVDKLKDVVIRTHPIADIKLGDEKS